MCHKSRVEKTVLDYTNVHQHDIQTALRSVQSTSIVAPNAQAPLPSLLMQRKKKFHLPNILLPKKLRRKQLPSNTRVSLGEHLGLLEKELGRGTYGFVALMNVVDKKRNSKIAIKVQSSIDSLSWELEILQRLEERLSESKIFVSSFPRPLSFISVADGALMSLSAASNSGLNLVDLSNFYRMKLRETVPELIALHYTSQMMKTIEVLHCHGQILHCDVKPDNFVVSTLNTRDNAFGDISFSDLTLVDFGRAVDLAQLCKESKDGQSIVLSGAATNPEMQCVAMRNQRPWSFDADTFGILASAHVLLFGSHLEIRQGSDGCWRPTTSWKRYWQQDLWNEVFHLLLNNPDNSIAEQLSALRKKIDSCLKMEARGLRAALTRQANRMPDSREQIVRIK